MYWWICKTVSVCVCVCTCGLPPSTYFLSFTHVQVPSHDNMTPEEALKHFQQEIPALGLLGTPHQIHSDTPYTVDDGVQLVCKYLKALQVGGKGGIDRLYQEGDEIALCACIAAIFLKLLLTHTHRWFSCSSAGQIQLQPRSAK